MQNITQQMDRQLYPAILLEHYYVEAVQVFQYIYMHSSFVHHTFASFPDTYILRFPDILHHAKYLVLDLEILLPLLENIFHHSIPGTFLIFFGNRQDL